MTGMSKLDCQGLGKIKRGYPAMGPGQVYDEQANDALLTKVITNIVLLKMRCHDVQFKIVLTVDICYAVTLQLFDQPKSKPVQSTNN